MKPKLTPCEFKEEIEKELENATITYPMETTMEELMVELHLLFEDVKQGNQQLKEDVHQMLDEANQYFKDEWHLVEKEVLKLHLTPQWEE